MEAGFRARDGGGDGGWGGFWVWVWVGVEVGVGAEVGAGAGGGGGGGGGGRPGVICVRIKGSCWDSAEKTCLLVLCFSCVNMS